MRKNMLAFVLALLTVLECSCSKAPSPASGSIENLFGPLKMGMSVKEAKGLLTDMKASKSQLKSYTASSKSGRLKGMELIEFDDEGLNEIRFYAKLPESKLREMTKWFEETSNSISETYSSPSITVNPNSLCWELEGGGTLELCLFKPEYSKYGVCMLMYTKMPFIFGFIERVAEDVLKESEPILTQRKGVK